MESTQALLFKNLFQKGDVNKDVIMSHDRIELSSVRGHGLSPASKGLIKEIGSRVCGYSKFPFVKSIFFVSSSKTIHAILCTVCQPMYLTLLRWICDGVIEDPYQEFFIAYNPKIGGDRYEFHAVMRKLFYRLHSIGCGMRSTACGRP